MTNDELDALIESWAAEPSVAPSQEFTDTVMRGTRRARAPYRTGVFDVLLRVFPSGALVGEGALLWVSGGAVAAAGAVLMLTGMAWIWFDDPLASDIKVRLSPW